jgi:hypothetical protein
VWSDYNSKWIAFIKGFSSNHSPSASPFNNAKVIFFGKAFECHSIYMSSSFPLPYLLQRRHVDCKLIDLKAIRCGGRRRIWGGALEFLPSNSTFLWRAQANCFVARPTKKRCWLYGVGVEIVGRRRN